MRQLVLHRLYLTIRGIAIVVAVCAIAGDLTAAVHDRVVVKADMECAERRWAAVRVRHREENKDAVGRFCTAELVSSLSTKAAGTPAEKACQTVYWPPIRDVDVAAVHSECHIGTQGMHDPFGGYLIISTRAWREHAASVPGFAFGSADALMMLAGFAPLLVIVGVRRWIAWLIRPPASPTSNNT